jgi:hypothetical protein
LLIYEFNLGFNTAELSSPSRRQQICQARALISYLALRELRISGADIARRMNIDRSSVSRTVGWVQEDPALKKKEQRIALPSVPGMLNILPQNKTTTMSRFTRS